MNNKNSFPLVSLRSSPEHKEASSVFSVLSLLQRFEVLQVFGCYPIEKKETKFVVAPTLSEYFVGNRLDRNTVWSIGGIQLIALAHFQLFSGLTATNPLGARNQQVQNVYFGAGGGAGQQAES